MPKHTHDYHRHHCGCMRHTAHPVKRNPLALIIASGLLATGLIVCLMLYRLSAVLAALYP